MARNSFVELQAQLQKVAAQLGFKDYREAIRALKKDQIVGDAILPHYRDRLRQIEEIVRREKLVSLPSREARIRISSAAESAAAARAEHAPAEARREQRRDG
jgi:septation ring formation regulator EzrA